MATKHRLTVRPISPSEQNQASLYSDMVDVQLGILNTLVTSGMSSKKRVEVLLGIFELCIDNYNGYINHLLGKRIKVSTIPSQVTYRVSDVDNTYYIIRRANPVKRINK